MRRILYLGCLALLLVGCDSGRKAAPRSPSPPAVGCPSVVEWHGVEYFRREVSALPRQGRSLGIGGVPSCIDVLGGETGASQAVEVRRLVGIDPRVAVAVAGDRIHAYLARRSSTLPLRP